MKKYFSFLTAALFAFGLYSCEDVPAPYGINNTDNGNGEETEVILQADFSSTLQPFTNYTTDGGGAWTIDYSTAKASGYDNSTKVTTAGTYYLVSPEVEMPDTAAHITFEYILRYNKGDENQQLLIMDAADFSSDNVAAGWTLLAQSFIEGSDWSTFSTADVQIPEDFLGKTVRIAFRYNTNSSSGSTWEVKNFKLMKGAAGEGGNDQPTGDLNGAGTLENPFTPAEAAAYASSLGSDKESPTQVYIKGKVSRIVEQYSTQYGNATFYISEDGSQNGEFYIFRALYLGNAKYTSGTNIEVGNDVIICGKVVNYKGNTPETVQNESYLYSLNGEGGNSGGGNEQPAGEASGDGTLSNPYNPVAANNYASSLAADMESSNEVYIKGKISRIANNGTFTAGGTYGNATFYISEDGSQNGEFYVFRTLYLGNTKYTAGSTDIKVGDEVIICGKVVNYMGNTPETVQNKSYLYSLNGTSQGGGNTGGNTGGNPTGGNASGAGTADSPFNVAGALAAYVDGQPQPSVVSGYIVGFVTGQSIASGATFGTANGASQTNFLIADSPNETNYLNCLVVQLPAGDIRNALNLASNPNNLGKSVTLTGSLEKYFGVAGLKSVSDYKF